MTVQTIVWITIGVAAGVTHTTSLWHSARESKAPIWGAVWRLPLVAGVLLIAAIAQGLLPVVVGWVVGLSGTSVLHLARSRRWM
jgi:hypothetical protein